MSGFGFADVGIGYSSHSPEKVFTDEQIVQAAFRHFREHGFPYRDLSLYDCMQEVNKLARTGNDELMKTSSGLSVADTYHPHRFEGRYMESLSPLEAFQSDDKWVLKCLRKSMEFDKKIGNTILGLHRAAVGGIKACSNFRCGFALAQYRQFCPVGGVVLDPCTGYGGRLVGWVASQSSKYVGVDPNTKTHEANLKMASDFGRSDDVKLHCQPVEDVDYTELENTCDFSFTSPPYFCAEIYSDQDTQSCHRYKTGKEWATGFLVPFMRFQFKAIKEGCFAHVNIADVKVKSKVIPLVKWCVQAGKKVGFTYVGEDKYKLQRHFGSGGEKNKSKPRTEAVLKFRKG